MRKSSRWIFLHDRRGPGRGTYEVRLFRRLQDGLRWFVTIVVDPTSGWAAFMMSRFEAGQMVLSHEHGDGAAERLGHRVAVFCHFDRYGRIRDHTRAYIDALRNEGFDVVLVTNSRALAAADRTWARERVAHVVV